MKLGPLLETVMRNATVEFVCGGGGVGGEGEGGVVTSCYCS